MVITDIKNTKIRVDSEIDKNVVIKALVDNGGVTSCDMSVLKGKKLIFVDVEMDILHCDDDLDFFNTDPAKEIFFYNGEFHDMPQDEDKIAVSEILELADEAVISGNKASHKLIELGYEYHQGGWISKEEIDKQEKVKKLTSVLWGSDLGIDGFDANVLAEKLIDLGVEYRKGEL